MKRVNLFKKIKLFLFYRKTLLNIERELKSQFKSRVDSIGRIYTVLNIPPQLIEEPYNIRKSDIDSIAQNFIREYSQMLSKFLNQNGLVELYDFYDMEKVDKYSYLLVFGFSLFNTKKVARRLLFFWTPFLIILGTILWIVFK